jgi:hypothetical protein
MVLHIIMSLTSRDRFQGKAERILGVGRVDG